MSNNESQAGGAVAPQELLVSNHEQIERNNISSRLRTALALGLVVASSAIGINACSDSAEKAAAAPTTDKEAAEMCNDFESSNAAANGSKYNTPNAFMPKTGKIDKSSQVREYIQSLFNENGPLAGNGDEASLAAIMATVVVPAHDGAVTDINFNYEAAYNARIAAYQGADGKKVAIADCKLAWKTLNQVAAYNDNWAQKGEQITEFQAVRDVDNADEKKRNNIVGMQLAQGISTETLKGIEFKLRKTAKGVDGFQEILLSTNEEGELDGRIFIRGFTKGDVSLDPKGTPRVSVAEDGTTTKVRLMPDGTLEVTTTTMDGKVSVDTGPAPGNTATGGSAGPNGTNPEAGPGGTTDSPANGGGTPTTGPGNPGTGPATTQPPRTTTTWTLPPQPTIPQTTTTQPRTTTTIPQTTTTQPYKPPIVGCDPAFEVCEVAMPSANTLVSAKKATNDALGIKSV